MTLPKRNCGPNALRRGRWSTPHGTYFATVCVLHREPVLVPHVAPLLLQQALRMNTDGSWLLRAMTVMPDHVHLLFGLGERLTLSQCLGRLKASVRVPLREYSAVWQENFYDHRLRAADSIEATLRYIWLNPYRTGLAEIGTVWPHFYCCPDDWAWFSGTTDDGHPFPEWLRDT